MSYHTNTLTSIQNVPDRVLQAPKNLLNRLLPARYPAVEVAAVWDMMGCSDLSYHLSKLAFETYDDSTPRGFSTDLTEMVESLLRARGHKIKGILCLHRAKGIKIAIATNGGVSTYDFRHDKRYGFMYSWSDTIDDNMIETMRRFL